MRARSHFFGMAPWAGSVLVESLLSGSLSRALHANLAVLQIVPELCPIFSDKTQPVQIPKKKSPLLQTRGSENQPEAFFVPKKKFFLR